MKEIAFKLKDEIIDKRNKFLENKIKRYPASNFRASDIHECDLYMVYSILNWEDRSLYDSGLQAVFDRGNKEESEVIKDLMDIGYEFVHQQSPFEIKSKDGEVICRGHIDGKILYEGQAIPCEIKSMNMNTFASLKTLDDFMKKPLHRKYLRQMQLYLYGNNCDAGLFILSDLQGHYKIFVIELDYGQMEAIIQRLENLWENFVKTKKLPEPIEFNDKICSYCPFKHICPNEVKFDSNIKMIDDKELEHNLQRREELKSSVEEFNNITDDIKNKFGKNELELYVGKNFLIKTKSFERASYEIPREIKEQYKDIKVYYRVNITKI